MVRLWFACGVLLWMVVGCQSEPFQASEVLESSSRAILGGAVDLRHPAVGRLMRGGGGFCTGTLIASKVILTAAHCVDAAKQAAQQNQKLEFFTEIPASGANPAQTKKYEIDKTLLLNHPQWNSNAALGFDIGVMVLKAAIPATEATPIAWNALEINNLWQWQSPLFLGYGLIRAYPSVQSTNTKQGVALGIVRVQRDRLLYYAAEQGICSGDSGGPALLKIQDQLRVIAVNSYVTSNVSGNQSACNWLGAGMRTDAYAVFLQDVLKLHGDGAALCAKDADCGGCGRCQGSRCQAQDPVQIATVCRPCAQDTDCGSDGRCTLLAGGWRCVQRCSASGCCPQASVCQPQGVGDAAKWLCMPTQTCADVVCTKDTECGLHGVCVQGKCGYAASSARAAKLCQPCEDALDCDGPEHLCLGVGEGRFCSQPCEAGGRCPQGFVCRATNAGSARQCVPSNGICQVFCVGNQACPQGWTCNPQRVCVPSQGVPTTGACNSVLACGLTLGCTTTVDGPRCLRPCRAPTTAGMLGNLCKPQALCDGGANCINTSSGTRCFHSCVVSADCKAKGGGVCPPANKVNGGQTGVCVCRLDEECAPGYRCHRESGRTGACLPAALFGSCPSGQRCGSLQEVNACVPDAIGIRQIGDECDALNRCRSGLVCLPYYELSNPNARGLCVESCPANKVCVGGGACTTVLPDTSVCLCQPNTCPAGRFCQRFEAFAVCLPSQDLLTQSVCRFDAECPALHRCDPATKRCVSTQSWPEPKPELQPEPVPEPIPEASPEPIHEAIPPEPSQEPQSKEPATESTLESAPSESSVETTQPSEEPLSSESVESSSEGVDAEKSPEPTSQDASPEESALSDDAPNDTPPQEGANERLPDAPKAAGCNCSSAEGMGDSFGGWVFLGIFAWFWIRRQRMC